MAIETMFSVPLFRFRLADWPEHKRRILAALPESGPHLLSPAGDTFTDFFLNQQSGVLPSYKDVVVKAVEPSLQEFAERYPENPKIDAMWFERSRQIGRAHV